MSKIYIPYTHIGPDSVDLPVVTIVVVVVVNISFQTKKNASMIGHCTALAVIVTKTLAGKFFEPKQDKDGKLTTPHVLV